MAATSVGVILGTVGYMAPEQIRGEPADHRADIFAVGTVLYEMVSGQRAFHGDSPADTMSAVLREQPPDLVLRTAHRPPSHGSSGGVWKRIPPSGFSPHATCVLRSRP